MVQVLAVVQFDHASGIPKDRATNTFHFASGAVPGAGDLANIRDMLWDFYHATYATRTVYKNLMSDRLVGNMTTRLYDLGDPSPRAPMVEYVQALPAHTDRAPLPEEVAIRMSTAADAVSGVNVGRLRGGIYLGPLAYDTTDVITADGDPRPTLVARTLIADAGEALMNAADASVTWEWVIHSTATTPAVDHKITSIWVDDAFDTIRKRGLDPTTRTVRVL